MEGTGGVRTLPNYMEDGREREREGGKRGAIINPSSKYI